jgi:hypothetical protein
MLHQPAAIHWEVRGVTRTRLAELRQDGLVKRDGAVVVQGEDEHGRLALVPLPPPG